MKEKREYPFDEFPDKGSVWEVCLKEYDRLNEVEAKFKKGITLNESLKDLIKKGRLILIDKDYAIKEIKDLRFFEGIDGEDVVLIYETKRESNKGNLDPNPSIQVGENKI